MNGELRRPLDLGDLHLLESENCKTKIVTNFYCMPALISRHISKTSHVFIIFDFALLFYEKSSITLNKTG